MSKVRVSDLAEFLLLRGLFLIFLFALYRTIFFARYYLCLRSEASSLCKIRQISLVISKSVKVTKNVINFWFRKWNLIFRFLSETKQFFLIQFFLIWVIFYQKKPILTLSKSSGIFKDVFFKFESCNFFKKSKFFSVYLRSCLFCNFF